MYRRTVLTDVERLLNNNNNKTDVSAGSETHTEFHSVQHMTLAGAE